MKLTKKFVLFLLSIVFVIALLPTAAFAANAPISTAKKIEKIYEVGQTKDIGDFLYKYFSKLDKVLESGDISSFKHLQNNVNSYIVLKDLEYRGNIYKTFHNGIQNVSVDQFIIKEAKENANDIDVVVYVLASYIYNGNEPGDEGNLYKVKLQKDQNGFNVITIDTTNVFTDIVKNLIKASSIVNASSDDSEAIKIADKFYDERNQVLPVEKQLAENAAKSAESSIISSIKKNSFLTPFTTSVSFSAGDAAVYGYWFGDHYENYMFKRVTTGEGDCTNFVSQCLWDGYGGCSGYNITTIGYDSSNYSQPAAIALRSRVANDYRQVTGVWYGRNYDSPYASDCSNFVSCNDLYNYATANTGNGPRATPYNNNGLFKNLTTYMGWGDVLQFYDSGAGYYHHSVIVDTSTSYYVSNYTNVRCAYHSSDYYFQPLDVLVQYFGGYDTCKMRVLRFANTTFNS